MPATSARPLFFSGDPLAPDNKALLEKQLSAEFRSYARDGLDPEVADEEIVRAMMVVRANGMTYNAPSPQLAQSLVDLINDRITPVVRSRGTLGEADLAPLGNIGATMGRCRRSLTLTASGCRRRKRWRRPA